MNLILEIQEIVSGPIKDLYLEITHGPLFRLPSLPPVNIQLGPDTVGDLNLGSSFGDQNLGSSFGDQFLGSSFDGQNLGSSFANGDQILGSTFRDQNLGSSNLEIPGSSEFPIGDLLSFVNGS